MTEPEPAPRRAAIWPALAGFSALLLAVGLAQVAVVALAAVLHRGALAQAHDLSAALLALISSGPLFTVDLAATCVAVGGTALGAARMLGGPLGPRLRLGPSRLGGPGYPLALLGLLALGNALEGIAGHLPIPSASLAALSAAAHGPLNQFVPLLLVGSLGAGCAEELFFRGFMAQALRARWGRTATVIVTAACFGLLHGDPLHGPLAFVLGLYLGFVAEAAQSIRPAVFAHVLNNATSFLSDRCDVGLQAQGTLGIALSALLAGVCVVGLWRAGGEGRRVAAPEHSA